MVPDREDCLPMINADLEARASAFTHDHKALALGRVDGRERRHGAGEHLDVLDVVMFSS